MRAGLPLPALRLSLLGLEAVKVADDGLRNGGSPSRVRGGVLSLLGSDQGEFARVEPVTATARALVHLDAAFGAKEMPVEFHPCAAGTFALAERVHDQPHVARDVQQGLACGLTFLIDLFQLEGIKPNPAATAPAHIHGDAANLEFG